MNIDWYMQCFIHGVKEVYVVGGGGCSDNTCSLAYAVYNTLCRSDILTVSPCHSCLKTTCIHKELYSIHSRKATLADIRCTAAQGHETGH